jgi:GNAT superfamily N-acetyltransferase
MHDMIVPLYTLPPLDDAVAALAARGVLVRRALAPEKPAVLAFVQRHFASVAAEVDAAFAQVPARCFVAIRDGAPVGFACHDVTQLNFFGPEGVAPADRGQGIGRALLLGALHAQRTMGYAYAIIGGVGPAEFYRKTVGAQPIAGSTPGIYGGLLRPPAA